MRNKLFKSTVSVLLALLLCLSVFAPAVSAASVGEAVLGEGGEVPANEQSNSATVAVNVTGEGSVKLLSDGTELTDHIPVGASFTVEAQPNTDRGYQPGTVVVTRNGVEQEGPSYGPAENGDAFEVNATFEFAPEEVAYEVNAASPKLKSADFNAMFDESGSRSYGYATISDPTNIKAVNLSSGTTFSAGSYYIYSAPYKKNNPDWSVAKVKKMNLRTFYTANVTVTGNEEGKVSFNNVPVEEGSAKLYTDTEYTMTVDKPEGYFYVLSGAEENTPFTPSAALNVKVAYYKDAHATFTLNINGEGTAAVRSDGEVTAEYINEGSTFTVETSPNTSRGYKLDTIVVTKNGEEVAATDGAYGPAANGESYVVTVNFKFDPDEVTYDIHADSKLTSTNLSGVFGDSVLSLLSKSYGIANLDTPDQITKLNTSGQKFAAGEYYIYRADGTSNPKWATARALKLKLRTYYNGSFTVTGHADGEVYLNNQAVSGSVKLYTGTEYTVTVKTIEGYDYTIEGIEQGVAFTPSEDKSVTVTYSKPAFATFTVNAGEGGTATVTSDGFTVDEHVNEGSTFTVEPHPNTDRGYKLDTVVVTKDGAVVEPVDGAYGPVADGENYVITVTFKFEPREVKYNLHAGSKLTSYIINDLFGDSILDMLSKSYGYAPVETPDQITTASTGGNEVEPGEYYIYRSNSSSNWSNAKVLKLTLKTYYNGSFAVSGHEEGEIKLNGEPVNGSVKLYTDQEYTVSVKQIEKYICTLYGAEDGVTFTPSADVEATAVYVKDQYASVAVSANEGGTVKIIADGNEMVDKVPEDSTFSVVATANAGNDYYVKSIVVTKDGEEIEAVDGEYGPVKEGENYAVTVTFAKASLTFEDGEVSLTDIYFEKYDEVRKSILANTAIDPEAFAANAKFEVEYVAYTLLGFAVYEPLNYHGDLGHAFGTAERGGTLKGGNTEKVRVTVTLPGYGIELSATAVMTVNDDRVKTEIETSADTFTITYGDDLKAAIIDTVSVTLMEDGQPVEFTADDITIDPASLNANLRSAQNAQEVTVRYNGSDIYAASETTVGVYVRRAQSSLEIENENITYGETPKAKVVTTPENLDHLKVIAGIDGDVQSFVSIIIPDSVKERMQIKVAGIVILDIYKMITSYIGEDGASVDQLKELIGELNDLIASSETVRQAIENSGFNVETLERILSFITELPTINTNLRIRLEQVPKNAGTYTVFAISTDTNYTTSEDVGYIIIRQKSTTEDETVELRFNEEIPADGDRRVLSVAEAQTFDFGGGLYVNDTATATDSLRVRYVGTTLRGDVIAQEEPVREAGVYVETVYMLGGNYLAAPVVREYTIARTETELVMDDLTVTYDGSAHSPKVYTAEGEELTDNVSFRYVGLGYLSSSAPVNAGEYTVYATYAGDNGHTSASATAKLTIEQRNAVITVSCKDTFTYGEINRSNLNSANLSYSVSGTVDGDTLGLIVPTLNTGDNFPDAGIYTATVRFVQTNANYKVTIKNATLTILPKQIAIAVGSAEKAVGEKDPAFTYTATDMKGKKITAKINVELAREEGETPGTYRIYVSALNETNYVLNEEASTDGVLTITGNPAILGDVDGDGQVTIKDVSAIQLYIAEELSADDINLQAADIDGNGSVNISDATALQLFLAEYDVDYPIGQIIK